MSAQAALCHLCCRPFGRLEDTRAPFAIVCGHVFCVGCLSHAERLCPICATAYDQQAYHRFLTFVQPVNAGGPLEPIPTTPDRDDGPHTHSRLLDAISRVDNRTSIPHIRHLHDTAYAFLQSQPRNCYKDLETNVRLLGCFLQAKETVRLQSELANELTCTLQQLHSENAQLRSQMDEVEKLYEGEKERVREIQVHISDHMRMHPEFNLFMDEMIAFRTEINELRGAVNALRAGDPSAHSTLSTPSLMVMTDIEGPSPPSSTLPLMPPTPDMDISQFLPSPLFIPSLPEVGYEPEAATLDVDLDLERPRPDLYSKPTEPAKMHATRRTSSRGHDDRRRTGYVPTEGEGTLALASALGDKLEWRREERRTENNASRGSSYATASSGVSSRTPTPEGFKKRVPTVAVTRVASPVGSTEEEEDAGVDPIHSTLARDSTGMLQLHSKHESLPLEYLGGNTTNSHIDHGLSGSVPEEGDADTDAEADRLMSLSTSSITLLKTPQNEMLNDTEYLQTRLHDLLQDVGSRSLSLDSGSAVGAETSLAPAISSTGPVPTAPMGLNPGGHSLLTAEMPFVRATRQRMHPRLDPARLSQHVMDEMRKALVEVVARAFVHLVSDGPMSGSNFLYGSEGMRTEGNRSSAFLRALDEELSSESDDSAGLPAGPEAGMGERADEGRRQSP